MKNYLILLFTVTFLVATPIQIALSADNKPLVKPQAKPTLQKISAPKIQQKNKPLLQPIKLTPQYKAKAKANKIRLKIKFEQLQNEFNQLTESAQMYEAGIEMIPVIRKECAEKSYTVQDQTAAGCKGNETLNQCMEKLITYCVDNFSQAGFSFPGVGSFTDPFGNEIGSGYDGGSIPDFSMESFRQSAKQTAAEARQLSNKMKQYANQAEENAKSW